MMTCALCSREFSADEPLTEPVQLAGQLLAEEEYGDAGAICPACLLSRGTLAMMYRPDCFD